MAIAIASHHSESMLCSSIITESAQASVGPRTIEGIRAAKKLVPHRENPDKVLNIVSAFLSKIAPIRDTVIA